MKTAELKATVREKMGHQHANKLRRENKIPAVVYGENGIQHLEVEYLPMAKLLHSPDLYLINLEAGTDKRRVMIKDAQYHPLTDKILHVDFLETVVGKPATLNIPVHIVGTSEGVLNGGQLVVKMRHLHIKGIPSELPEFVEVDITNLTIGKSIKVGDIKEFEILDPKNAVVVQVKTARKLEEIVPVVAVVEGEEGAEGAEGEEKTEAGEEGSDSEEKKSE